MKKTILIIALLLTGCGSQFRHPFCSSSITKMPDEFLGRYEVTYPLSTTAWSGSVIMKSFSVELTPTQILSSQKLPDQVSSWAQVCKVDSRIFIENQNANGTYSIAEVAKGPLGVTITPIVLEFEQAQKLGFSFFYVPSTEVALKGGMSYNALFSAFILDNTRLTQNQILQVAQGMSVAMLLRPESTDKPLDVQFRMPLSGLVR